MSRFLMMVTGLIGSMSREQSSQLFFASVQIQVSNENISHSLTLRLPIGRETLGTTPERLKRRCPWKSPSARFSSLECLYVFSLPTLGTLGHLELHGLAFL